MRKSRVSKLASALSFSLLTLAGSAASAANLTSHGGPVITSVHVVFIFWGPSFNNASSPDHTYATTLQTFRNQLGTTGWYSVLTQYCGSNGCIGLSNLGGGTPDLFDTSTPPTNVTDTAVRNEVNKYLLTHTKDNSAIYMVFIPSTSFSSSGTSTSCGGPSFAYCSYHSWIGSGATATKYTIQPYPSCSGCQVPGWTAVQDQELLVAREIADTVTDPTRSTWWDSSGSEIADKCTLTFLAGGFAYPYLWSNATGSCVQ
ncbi:MAG TPA: hypothetical protein VGR07_11905 [Thermoanaerobaculia bacterium]|nr:hypothetical protein [Thermoanaerobaculia bacterium]